MAAAAARNEDHTDAHIPVLLRPLLAAISPISGTWIDGTFGAGGYTRAILDAGADQVIAMDRDPTVFEMAKPWAPAYDDRLMLVEDTFDQMAAHADGPVQGVVLDIGVSSMQIDQAHRGFSFAHDGPLDMRMGDTGPNAAELVNNSDEATLADILYLYGEERASRRIARAIVAARAKAPITTTATLAEIISGVLPRPKPGQIHPATRSFQALRIAVNDELGQLHRALEAAETVLAPGGLLAVVTFHSLEDRIVKRFMALRSDKGGGGNRYAPATQDRDPGFEVLTRRAVAPDDIELQENPRARSAKLRVARRTSAPPASVAPADLGVPLLPTSKGRK